MSSNQDKFPVVLALDTSTAACSVAVQTETGDIFSEDVLTPQSHANELLSIVQGLLKTANLNPKDFDFLIYGEGPGAFTGIRIACGVIQGLAVGWNKPVLAMSSLSSLAKGAMTEQFSALQNFDKLQWISLVDARMKEVYWQSGEMGCEKQKLLNWHESAVEMLPAGEFSKRLERVLNDFNESNLVAHPKTALVICGDIAKEYPEAVKLITSQIANQITNKNSSAVFWCAALPNAKAMIELANLRVEQAGDVMSIAKSIDEQLPKPLYLRNHVADTIAERQAKKLLNF